MSALSYTEDHNVCLVWEVVVEVKLHSGGFCFVWDSKVLAGSDDLDLIEAHLNNVLRTLVNNLK